MLNYNNSSVIGATSMFELSITSRWALMAARGWARLILDRCRDLINDRPSRTAAAAEAPLPEPRSATTLTTPLTTHAVPFTTAKLHSSFALPCTSAYNLAPPLGG